MTYNNRTSGDEMNKGAANVRSKETGQAGPTMDNTASKGVSRRGLLQAFAATSLVAAPTYANAFGFLKGAGDIRRIKMYNGRTGESMDTIYWVEGDYIGDALAEVNHFMRDWRRNEVIRIDTRTLNCNKQIISNLLRILSKDLNTALVFPLFQKVHAHLPNTPVL